MNNSKSKKTKDPIAKKKWRKPKLVLGTEISFSPILVDIYPGDASY